MSEQKRNFKKIARFLTDVSRPARTRLLAAFAANLASAFFEGTSIALLALAVQVIAAPEGSRSLFLPFVLLAIAAQVLRSALQFLGQAMMAAVQSQVQAETHHRIFAHILRLPFPQVARHRLGNLTDGLRQADHLHDLFGKINELALSSLLVATYGLIMVWLSWPLTLAALIASSLVSALIKKIIRTIHRHSRAFVQTSVALSERTTEFLQGMRLLHTLGHQERTIQTTRDWTRQALADRRKATVWASSVEPIADTLAIISAGAFLLLGTGVLVPMGLVTLPLLLAFLLALHRVTARVRAVQSCLVNLARLIPSVDRILEILSEKPAQPARGKRTFSGFQREIAFDQVTLQYHSEEAPAVSGLSLAIPKGSFTALVGASGAGKSTVADLLLRLYEPTAGTIRVDGVDLRQIDPVSWRNRLGVVSQDPFLFHLSIRDNIVFGKQGSEEEVAAAAAAAHADEFIRQLARGYDTVIGERGYRLSGGERQRICLARALIGRPEILILDEATSALDSESERFIQQALEEQRRRCTLLVIAHRISTVARADRIIVLSEGRIAEEGTHAGLLASGGIYSRLWRLQSEERSEALVP